MRDRTVAQPGSRSSWHRRQLSGTQGVLRVNSWYPVLLFRRGSGRRAFLVVAQGDDGQEATPRHAVLESRVERTGTDRDG